jgi:hypothetical protein
LCHCQKIFQPIVFYINFKKTELGEAKAPTTLVVDHSIHAARDRWHAAVTGGAGAPGGQIQQKL